MGLSLLGGIIASSYFAWKSNGRYRQALASAGKPTRRAGNCSNAPTSPTCRRIQAHWGKISFGLDDILAANRPDRTEGIDLRRFEWHFWKRQLSTSHRVLQGHEGFVHDVAYSPDGRHLATAGFDGTVRIWDIATGDQVRIFRPGPSSFTSVAFSPDGTCLAAAEGFGLYLAQDSGVVILWDWRTDRGCTAAGRSDGRAA